MSEQYGKKSLYVQELRLNFPTIGCKFLYYRIFWPQQQESLHVLSSYAPRDIYHCIFSETGFV